MTESRVEILDDVEELSSFFSIAWPQDLLNTKPESIIWRYRKKSEGLKGVNFVYRSDGRIVGHLGALPVKLFCNTELINAAWLFDWYVLPSHRSSLAGMKLMNTALKTYSLTMAVGLTQISESIFRRTGWEDGGIIEKKCYLLNPMMLIINKYRFTSFIPGMSVINYVYNKLSFRDSTLSSENCQIKETNFEPETAESIVKRSLTSDNLFINRDAEYLKARYGGIPPWNYGFVTAYVNDKTSGWAVYSIKDRTDGIREGNLIECIALDERIKSQLIRFILLKMQESSVHIFDVSNRNVMENNFPFRFNLFYRPGLRFMWRWNSKDEIPELLKNQTKWYISKGDSDQDR